MYIYIYIYIHSYITRGDLACQFKIWWWIQIWKKCENFLPFFVLHYLWLLHVLRSTCLFNDDILFIWNLTRKKRFTFNWKNHCLPRIAKTWIKIPKKKVSFTDTAFWQGKQKYKLLSTVCHKKIGTRSIFRNNSAYPTSWKDSIPLR